MKMLLNHISDLKIPTKILLLLTVTTSKTLGKNKEFYVSSGSRERKNFLLSYFISFNFQIPSDFHVKFHEVKF